VDDKFRLTTVAQPVIDIKTPPTCPSDVFSIRVMYIEGRGKEGKWAVGTFFTEYPINEPWFITIGGVEKDFANNGVVRIVKKLGMMVVTAWKQHARSISKTDSSSCRARAP
jgi:hypothetical protein